MESRAFNRFSKTDGDRADDANTIRNIVPF